jgi:hypothetical protein
MTNGNVNIILPALKVSGTAKSHMAFAVHHLMAAARFSRQCHKIEADHQGQTIDYFFNEIITCCSATIILSVASIEANINEIFFDSANFPEHTEQVVRKKFQEIDKGQILEKYQEALRMRKVKEFEKGKDLEYQHAQVLINLRNALVHFKPEWENAQNKHEKIGDALRGKFKFSPFFSKYEPIFPKRFISHGCCKWSVETALNLIAAFNRKAGLPNKFEVWHKSAHAGDHPVEAVEKVLKA